MIWFVVMIFILGTGVGSIYQGYMSVDFRRDIKSGWKEKVLVCERQIGRKDVSTRRHMLDISR